MPTCRDNWRAKKRRRDRNLNGTTKVAVNWSLRNYSPEDQAHIRNQIAFLPLEVRRMAEAFWREMYAKRLDRP